MRRSVAIMAATVFMIALTEPSVVFAADDETVARATHFIDSLAKGDYAGASAMYDAAMRQALPEPQLKQTWLALQKQVGAYKERGQMRTSKSGAFDIVLVTCRFEKTTLDAKVVLNGKGEVSGLFFVPTTAATEPGGPPAYVLTNLFREREFTVGNGEWHLPGTLSMPAVADSAPCPAVVLVHGSGPNDRDETIGGAKPFRDLAWGLATKGLAVLRYEKRTRHYTSRFTGLNPPKLTVREEIIDDALSAARQLREVSGIDPEKVFVLGHSEGGAVGPRIAAADPKIAGLIILAGATRPLEDLIVDQTRYLISLNGTPSPSEQEHLRNVETAVAVVKKLTPSDASSSSNILGAPAAYWLDLRAHDPVTEAKTLKMPILILQGGRDYQVTHLDFNRWKQGLAASPNVSFKLYPELNHLFTSGEGKSTPQEYEKAAHVSATVVSDIANWILSRH